MREQYPGAIEGAGATLMVVFDPVRVNAHNWPLPDRDVALEALRSVTDDVEIVAVFSTTSFDVLYVGDAFGDAFDTEADLYDHLSTLSADVRGRFAERELVAGAHPAGGGTQYTTHREGDHRLLHLYCAGRGMFLGVGADAPVDELVTVGCRLLTV